MENTLIAGQFRTTCGILQFQETQRFFDRSMDTKIFKCRFDAHNHPDFYRQLGQDPNANASVHSDLVVTNAQAADLAALMTDPHQGDANTVMAYDGHETTHLDQVTQSHLHAANVHLL
jgi:hypothetical protein